MENLPNLAQSLMESPQWARHFGSTPRAYRLSSIQAAYPSRLAGLWEGAIDQNILDAGAR
jgi:hypothetical protein